MRIISQIIILLSFSIPVFCQTSDVFTSQRVEWEDFERRLTIEENHLAPLHSLREQFSLTDSNEIILYTCHLK